MLKSISIQNQEDREYVIIPDDMYVCEIKDLEEAKQQKYQAPEGTLEEAIRIKLVITEGEFKGHTLVKQVRPQIGKGFKGGSPSNLYLFLDAVLGYADASIEAVNETIGKQVRVIVKSKTGKDGRVYNYIDSFMKNKRGDIKKEDIPIIENADENQNYGDESLEGI